MFTSHGAELYKDLISFINKVNADVISRDSELSLSQAFDAANYMIEDFKHSSELMDSAINFYDPNDLIESHAVNVAVFSLKMATDLNLSETDVQDTVASALFHDIGFSKIIRDFQNYESVVDENLLSEDDLNLVKKHSQYSYESILRENDRENRIAEIILQHHEKADGSGYPQGLREDQQLVSARIISILDIYEALIHPRPYRDALIPPKGIETLVERKGTAYSSNMIKVLINSFSLYPVGQFVQLNNGMIGRVIKTYKENPISPDVKLYFNHSGEKLNSPRIVRLREDPIIKVEQCLPGFEEYYKYI